MAGKEKSININDSSAVVAYDKTKNKGVNHEETSDEEPEVIQRPLPKNINISGTDHLHFGNTYVSYGIINVPNETAGPKGKSVNLLDYLNLNDDITSKYNNRRPTVKFSQKPLNITINSRRAALEKQKQLKKEQEKKKCVLAIYMFLACVVVLLLIYLYVVFVYMKLKDKDSASGSSTNPSNSPTTVQTDHLSIRPRGFGIDTNRCQPDSNIGVFVKKTRLRLVITKSLVFFCSYNFPLCYDELQEEYELHKRNNFNDIYYNYVINSKGAVIKGRSVTNCGFDEEFLPDHSDVIIVGIGYCFNDDQTNEYRTSEKESETIVKLINKLQNLDFLSRDYSLEILNECSSSQLVKSLPHDLTLSYYDASSYESRRGVENVFNSVYIGEELNEGYGMNSSPLSSSSKFNYPHSYEPEQFEYSFSDVKVTIKAGIQIGSCDLDCGGVINSLKNYLPKKESYVVFLNGTICKKQDYEKSGKNENVDILITQSCVGLREPKKGKSYFKISWRDFIKNFFQLSKLVKKRSRKQFLSSTFCRFSKYDYYYERSPRNFVPLISLPFNARDTDKMRIINPYLESRECDLNLRW